MSISNSELQEAYTPAVDWMALRNALRQRRTERGKSLDDLSKETKVNRATIHSIENVKREPNLKPRIETVETLARALGLKMSELFLLAEGDSLSLKGELPPEYESAPLSVQDAERVSRFTRALYDATRSALATARAANALREAREHKSKQGVRGA